MLASVLKRYPSISVEDISIQDDGNGPFISKWNSNDSQPTSEELLIWEAEDSKLPKPKIEIEHQLELIQAAIDDLIFSGGGY